MHQLSAVLSPSADYLVRDQLRTRKKVSEEVELVDMRPPGVGGIEVESPVEDARDVVLDQPSKVHPEQEAIVCPPSRLQCCDDNSTFSRFVV